MQSGKFKLRGGVHANLFLRSLRPGDALILKPMLSRVDCRCGQVLASGDECAPTVFFPESILVGLIASGSGSAVGLVGREGMVGWAGMLGVGHADYHARVMMGAGTALAIPVDRLREACFVSPTLSLSILCFAQALAMQMSWSLLSVRNDTLSQRISALLLMIHDRIDGNEIPATHRALARHLGVRRATVTNTLHLLEGERALRNKRGRITIRDRHLMEAAAGPLYRSKMAKVSAGATLQLT